MPVTNLPDVGIAPEPIATLWRYMELDRFKSLLERKALFFCRADKFSDPFEGSIPRKEYQLRSQRSIDIFSSMGSKPAEEFIIRINDMFSSEGMNIRQGSVINCWHKNSNESDAMWNLYLKTNEGVAIQTNTARLIQSLQKAAQDVFISDIRYIDYENAIFCAGDYQPAHSNNFLMPLIHKRNEFIHEREVRLIHLVKEAVLEPNYWEGQDFYKGVFISVDLNVLVDKIILPPTSDEKVRQEVDFLIKQFGYHFEFEKSALSKQAYF
jgi:hypothetical protein